MSKSWELLVPPDFSEDEDGNPDDQGDAGNYQDCNYIIFDDLEEVNTQCSTLQDVEVPEEHRGRPVSWLLSH